MDIKAHAKYVIESLTCAIHHEHPNLSVFADQIAMYCCCREFKIICLNKLIRLFVDHKDHKPA